ncbi:MAG: MFS transporter [Saprospiraceae bacterium]|nr:MFS transporter [Saprospiraceae bacterium]
MINDKRLFYGSCFALITTAFSFSIRAGVMPQLEIQLGLSATQLGFINQMWFWGFPISMIIGGLIYHKVGGAVIMQFAFFAHAVGILLTIFAGSYFILLISSLLIGLGNGCTEAACNPMIADAYEGDKISKMLNRFHMWFPGGILVGSLLSQAMTSLDFSWQMQVGFILIPTVIYAYLFFGQKWPTPKSQESTTLSGNFSSMLTPLFLFILLCMGFTAVSEFGPNNWVPLTLKGSGATPMLVMALTFGLMTVARYFGGEVVARFSTTGVLLGSAICASLGLYLLSNQSGGMVYIAAIVYGLGIAYFWPNMIGFVARYIPDSGALGMSIVGAMGMFASGLVMPIFGGLIDKNRVIAAEQGLSGEALDVATGQMTLSTMALVPLALIVLFTILHFWIRNRKEVAVAH